jgi:hypothetical protein
MNFHFTIIVWKMMPDCGLLIAGWQLNPKFWQSEIRNKK